jgi:hypothetical protein
MACHADEALANLQALSEAELDELFADAIAAASQSCKAWPANAWLAGGVLDMSLEPAETAKLSELQALDVSVGERPHGTRYSSPTSTPSHFIYRPAA